MSEFSHNRLSKSVIYVFAANILNMILSLITNFLLPKYLSVDSYAAIKTFQLYVNYIGVFHLGFVDGVYLNYGGKDLVKLEKNRLLLSLSTARIFQLFVTVIMIIYSVTINDFILLAFSMTILPVNAAAYFRMLFQAVGEFSIYRRITNISTVLTFIANIAIIFVLKTDNSFYLLLCYVFIDIIIWLTLEKIFSYTINEKNIKWTLFSLNELVRNIKNGFSLMCGNLASFILTGLDRWFVKFTLDNFAFAQYSFAVSIENMLNLIITPITLPLYNYFCREKDKEKIRKMHKGVTLAASIIISSAFFAKLIIEKILPGYKEASIIIFYLFAARAIDALIQAIYINLYKVNKKNNLYFLKLIIVLFSGIVFNYIFFSIWHVKEAYAIGTMVSAVLWIIISIVDFKEYLFDISDFIYLFLEIVVFLLCGLLMEAMIGFLVYFVVTVILLIVFMKKYTMDILYMGLKYIKNRRNKDKI